MYVVFAALPESPNRGGSKHSFEAQARQRSYQKNARATKAPPLRLPVLRLAPRFLPPSSCALRCGAVRGGPSRHSTVVRQIARATNAPLRPPICRRVRLPPSTARRPCMAQHSTAVPQITRGTHRCDPPIRRLPPSTSVRGSALIELSLIHI